jgi:hypothetical protein
VVKGISALICCWVSVIPVDLDSAHAGALNGFSEGYAYSASLVCRFDEGPLLSLRDFRTLNANAQNLGMRNFFVALRLYGQVHACKDAISDYGPGGIIRSGLLERGNDPEAGELVVR